MLALIAPNILPPIAFVAVLDVARMMIFEAILGFIGIGVQPPTPTFGSIIADGRKYLINAWWIATMPGLFLFLALLVPEPDGRLAGAGAQHAAAGDDLMAAAPLLEVKGLSVELQRGSERRAGAGRRRLHRRRPAGARRDRRERLRQDDAGQGRWSAGSQPPLRAHERSGAVPRPRPVRHARRRAAGPARPAYRLYRRRSRQLVRPDYPGRACRSRRSCARSGRRSAGATPKSASSACSIGSTSRRPRAATTSSRTSIRAACCSGR